MRITEFDSNRKLIKLDEGERLMPSDLARIYDIKVFYNEETGRVERQLDDGSWVPVDGKWMNEVRRLVVDSCVIERGNRIRAPQIGKQIWINTLWWMAHNSAEHYNQENISE